MWFHMGVYATFVIREEKWNMCKGCNTKVANKGEIPLHVVCAMFPLTLKCSVNFLLDGNTSGILYPFSPCHGLFLNTRNTFHETLPRTNWTACAASRVPQVPFSLCNHLLLEWAIPRAQALKQMEYGTRKMLEIKWNLGVYTVTLQVPKYVLLSA